MRKNIFQLLQNSKIDIKAEYRRIKYLFEEEEFYYYQYITISKFIDSECFSKWPYRKRCIKIDEMKDLLEVDDFNMDCNLNINRLLTYMEFIINITSFSIKNTNSVNYITLTTTLLENITDLLNDMNYEIQEISEEQYIIVEKDSLSTAVAETIPSITTSVIEYRRFSLKGDIDSKSSILKELANKIEPLDKKFKSTEFNSFMDDIGTLLNNLNIRHNNIEGKYKQPYIVDMKPEELEEWYDKTYDMILVALLIDKYIDDKSKIKELKKYLK